MYNKNMFVPIVLQPKKLNNSENINSLGNNWLKTFVLF